MGRILHRTPRIRWGCSLSKNLEFVLVGGRRGGNLDNSIRNLVSGVVGTVNQGSTALGDIGPYGQTHRFDSDNVSWPYHESGIDKLTPYTFSIVLKPVTYPDSFKNIGALNVSDSSSGRLVFYLRSGSSYGLVGASKNSGSVYESRVLPSRFTVGEWIHIVVTRSELSAEAPKFYVDGIDETAIENFSYGAGNEDLVVLGCPWATYNNLYGDYEVEICCIWNREFTPGEVKFLYTKPKHIILPPQINVAYFSAAGPTAKAVTDSSTGVTEAPSISATLSQGDANAGSTEQVAVTASLALTDGSTSVTETVTVNKGASVADSNTSVTEVPTISASANVTDANTSVTESAEVAATIPLSDGSIGITEDVDILRKISVSDGNTGSSENVGVSAQVPVSDSSTGVTEDVSVAGSSNPQVVDGNTGVTEAISITVTVPVADGSAGAVESINVATDDSKSITDSSVSVTEAISVAIEAAVSDGSTDADEALDVSAQIPVTDGNTNVTESIAIDKFSAIGVADGNSGVTETVSIAVLAPVSDGSAGVTEVLGVDAEVSVTDASIGVTEVAAGVDTALLIRSLSVSGDGPQFGISGKSPSIDIDGMGPS